MSRKPLHIDKLDLFCNRCQCYVNKYTETTVVAVEVLCLNCDNWLCGEYDAFGNPEYQDSPSIERIKGVRRPLTKRNIFIAQFLRLICKKLVQDLPAEGFESEYIEKGWGVLAEYCKHLGSAVS
jgi:hypothetical protein